MANTASYNTFSWNYTLHYRHIHTASPMPILHTIYTIATRTFKLQHWLTASFQYVAVQAI